MDDGRLFRKIRKSHNLTLAQVADKTCSVSFISKFERGERQISHNRLLHLLMRVGVSIEEFSFQSGATVGMNGTTTLPISAPYIIPFRDVAKFDGLDVHQLNDAQLDELKTYDDQLLDDKNEARWQKFFRIFRRIIYEVALTNVHRPPYANVAAMMAAFREQIRPVVAYLYKVDEWGTFELFLLRMFGSEMDADTQYTLTKAAYQRNHAAEIFPQNADIMTNLIQGAFSRFVYDGNYAYARACLDWHSHMRTINKADNALMTLFMRGWYAIYAGDFDDGVAQCQHVIDLVTELGLKEWAANQRKALDLILKSHRNPEKYILFL